MPQLNNAEIQQVDKALAIWRQGDVALQEKWFTHIADPSRALTPESSQADGTLSAITSEVEGLAIVTQSCDIVRTCSDRPFLEVVPLVKVDSSFLYEVKKGQRPAYVFIPATEEFSLVAHIDRVMTVEKTLVANWQRTQGCKTDAEIRAFAQTLARKRSRSAFPDDFTQLASTLQDRLQEKHDKQTPEGDALRALREIRVRAAPSWHAANIELFFWFIRDEMNLENKPWDSLLVEWLKLIQAGGRFASVEGIVVLLEDLTAKDYVESDPLDLDYLSSRRSWT